MAGGRRLPAGSWWLVADGWYLVAGGCWLLACSWRLVADGWCLVVALPLGRRRPQLHIIKRPTLVWRYPKKPPEIPWFMGLCYIEARGLYALLQLFVNVLFSERRDLQGLGCMTDIPKASRRASVKGTCSW